MKVKFLIVIPFLLLCTATLAQEGKSFSLELGAGIGPLHMQEAPFRSVEEKLAEQGREADMDGSFCPAFSLSGVWRPWSRAELVLTGGLSWCHHRITQYPSFGTDPNGKPRYDLQNPSPAGWMDSSTALSLTVEWRRLWNPGSKVEAYSELGVGVAPAVFSFIPLPSITPLGLRGGGDHLYFFLEGTLGPVARYVHGGVGLHF